MTAIVPVRDDKAIAAKVKARNPGASVDAASGFAAVTPAGPYKRGGIPARLAGPIPPETSSYGSTPRRSPRPSARCCSRRSGEDARGRSDRPRRGESRRHLEADARGHEGGARRRVHPGYRAAHRWDRGRGRGHDHVRRRREGPRHGHVLEDGPREARPESARRGDVIDGRVRRRRAHVEHDVGVHEGFAGGLSAGCTGNPPEDVRLCRGNHEAGGPWHGGHWRIHGIGDGVRLRHRDP